MFQRHLLLLVVTFGALAGPQDAPRYDLLIAGGRVVDGSGAPAERADVAVTGGSIARVGLVPRSAAREVLDARGLVIAPGFIDVHTHADDLADHARAENFVRMGVTTIVAGNCGRSALDVGAALEKLRQTGASVNFATLVGHNTVRQAVMGAEDRAPTIPELDRMKSLVWRAMADGAVGFSTGLQYVPGTYARTPEIIELARVAGNAGGVYASHMRNGGTALEESVRETIPKGSPMPRPSSSPTRFRSAFPTSSSTAYPSSATASTRGSFPAAFSWGRGNCRFVDWGLVSDC